LIRPLRGQIRRQQEFDMIVIRMQSLIFSAFSALIASLAGPSSLPAQATSPGSSPPAATAPGSAAAGTELFRLKNDDLIKQAQTLSGNAENEYRAQLRNLATVEMLLEDVRTQAAGVKIPPSPATAPAPLPRAAMDAATLRKTASAQALRLAQAQKALLDRISAACDACQASETACLNALDELRPYAVEVALRVSDNSIASDKSPAFLMEQALLKRRTELRSGREKRKARVAVLTKEQDAAVKSVEEAGKILLAAEADVTQASAALARDERSEDLKKQYAGRKPDDLATELNGLADEGIALKGAFKLSLARFNFGLARVDALSKEVEAMKPPEVKIPQLARPEDVEQAAAGTQQLIDFYSKRTKSLETSSAALTSLLALGTEFNADATVSTEHLFKMRTIAELLKKSPSANVQIIRQAEPDKVVEAEQTESKEASGVQAAVERAKAQLPLIDKQLAETRGNAESAAGQLVRLKQSQSATLAVIAWEGKLKTMTPEQSLEAFAGNSKALTGKLAGLEKEKSQYQTALTAATELTTKFDNLKDPLLRAAEEAGQAEKVRILGELRKEAGLDRVDAAPAAAAKPDAAAPARASDDLDKKSAPAVKKPEPTPMEKAVASLQAFQQVVSGRLRVLDDRELVGKDLLASIAALDAAGNSYGKALADARQLATQLHTTAINLKKRTGKGEIAGEKLPPEVSQALRPDLLAQLDADSAALLTTESQFRQKKEAIQKPDPTGDTARSLTKEVLGLVGQRLDLLADLHRLDAACNIAAKDRDPGEARRLEQEAAERQAAESSKFDAVLSIDTSKRGKSLADLLDSDYRELVDTEYREDNLRQQRDKAHQLLDLAQKEQTAIAKMLPILTEQAAAMETAREEEAVIARIRLKPEQADELIKGFKAKTGRLLARPVPVGEKEKAAKVDELAASLYDKSVQAAAAKNWENLLGVRLIPGGIPAEAGAYQDEVARINAVSGANARRIESLSGQKPPEPGSREAAAITGRQVWTTPGGSIAKTRGELTSVRSAGVRIMLMKLLALLIGAWLLPKLLMPLISHGMSKKSPKTDEHGNAALLLAAIRVFVKTAVWIVAIALILSVLGVDITAIIAGLGIGGLAIGLAAQPMISDVISALVIFAERRFTIGDVIRIGGDDPAKVVGLSWRGTQLKGSDGLVVNVPNRNITGAVVRNLTKEGRTFDSLTINVTTEQEVSKVMDAIKKATEECKYLTSDSGYSIQQYQHKGPSRAIKYQFWWYLRDFDVRNKTRDEVFTRFSENLSGAEMAGTEVSLA
jgi:small-conductance mechanosensitive channel